MVVATVHTYKTLLIMFISLAAESTVGFSQFGQGSGPIHLDNLRCVGTESRLIDCPHNGVGIEDCSHFEDAGVTCEGERVADVKHIH